MKYIFIIIFLFSETSLCLTKSQALQQAKNRIDALTPTYALFAYTCFVYETDCDITDPSQEVVLKLILNELDGNKIDIRYSDNNPDFMIDGALRIAKTGSSWGSPVLFNENLLTVDEGDGDFRALEFMEILGVLIHEFGHHQEQFMRKYGLRVLNHQELDAVAAKVVYYLENRTRRVHITPQDIPLVQSKVTLYWMDVEQNNGARIPWSYVFVDSEQQTREISSDLLQNLSCPKKYTSGHLTFSGKASNAYYKNIKAPELRISENHVTLEQDIADATVMCIDSQMHVFSIFNGYTNGHLSIDFAINSNHHLEYKYGYFSAHVPPDQSYWDE